jgi:hypothetical protein
MLSRKQTILAAVLAAAAPQAWAQAPAPWPSPRWYVEISGGRSETSDELVRNRESTIVNATDIRSDFDAKDSAWKLGGGYRFLPWLALEVNYVDLGSVNLRTTMDASGLFAGIAIDRKVTGWGADAVFSAPFGSAFSVYGRVGAFRSRLETSSQLSGNIVFTNGNSSDTYRSITRNETVARVGVGFRWDAWRNGGVHAEFERYNNIGKAFAVGGSGTTGEADVDAWWIGIHQAF